MRKLVPRYIMAKHHCYCLQKGWLQLLARAVSEERSPAVQAVVTHSVRAACLPSFTPVCSVPYFRRLVQPAPSSGEKSLGKHQSEHFYFILCALM